MPDRLAPETLSQAGQDWLIAICSWGADGILIDCRIGRDGNVIPKVDAIAELHRLGLVEGHSRTPSTVVATPEGRAICDLHEEQQNQVVESLLPTKEEADYLDLGWSGRGWPPSTMFKIAVFEASTRHFAFNAALSADDSLWMAKRRAAQILNRARQRWRDGFYADPFTTHPISRCAVEPQPHA